MLLLYLKKKHTKTTNPKKKEIEKFENHGRLFTDHVFFRKIKCVFIKQYLTIYIKCFAYVFI